MITLKPVPETGKDSGAGGSRFDIKQAGQFEEHGSSVWRVCWNITGTILASSGDDGCVKLWKANYLDNWACVSTLRADGQVRERERSGGDLIIIIFIADVGLHAATRRDQHHPHTRQGRLLQAQFGRGEPSKLALISFVQCGSGHQDDCDVFYSYFQT